MIRISCTGIVKVHKIHQLFATAYTSARYVKPAQPIAPTYQTPTLLMEGTCQAMPAKPASVNICLCLIGHALISE